MAILGNSAWFNSLLGSSNGLIPIPEGIVLVDGPLHRIQSKQVVGAGKDLTIFQVVDYTSGAVIFDVTPNSIGAGIEQLSILWPNTDCNSDPDLFANAPAVRIGEGSHNTLVSNIRITQAVQGIVCNGQGVTIENYSGMPVYRGIQIGASANQVKISNLDLTDLWYSAGCELESWQLANGIGVENLGGQGVRFIGGFAISDKYGSAMV